MVCFAWIFFRAPTLRASFSMLRAMSDWRWSRSYMPALLYLATLALPLMAIDLYLERSEEEYPTQRAAFAWKLSAATAALVIIAFGAAYEPAPFVYFQF